MTNAKSKPLENIAAERIVLGKVLQAESAYWAVADTLQPQHFSRDVHRQIFQAVKDILTEGKKMSLTLLQSRIGEEYGDGLSTMTLLTALLRDADKDENAGGLEESETIIDLWRHRTYIATLEKALKEAKKPDAISVDLMAEHELRIKDIGVNSQAEPLKSLGQIAQRALTRSITANRTGEMPGFDTGLPSLDEIVGRIHPGDLGFIGARPGDGKTVMGVQLSMRAQFFGPTLYHQLEMRDEDMARRILAGETGLSVADIEAGSYDVFALDLLKDARASLGGSRLFIDDRPKLSVEQIRDRCVSVKRSKGLVLVVVDHIRLVRSMARVRDKWERMEFITGELKALAKDLDIAIVCLSQVTRSSQRRDDPSPQLNDFDGGSSIEQDADWALGIFRRDRWLKNQRPHDMESQEGRDWAEEMRKHKGKIEVTVLKRRRGEDGERREFEFDGRRGMLKELER